MNPDMDLVREYLTGRSEQSFERLVSRHIALVYSSALRQVRDPNLAEEITQAVFIILARKAASLSPKTILPGWLYRTTRFTAANALRTRATRQRYEQEAVMEFATENSSTETAWLELAPLLDEAMARLRQTDRDALLLRYFENKSLRDVGAALGTNEESAKKRVARSLEKLRNFFKGRGVSLSATVIAGALSANSVQAVPVGLAVAVATAAQGTALTTSTATLVKGALKLMAWAKMKTAAVIGGAIVLTTVTVTQLPSLFHPRHPVQPGQLRLPTGNVSPRIGFGYRNYAIILASNGSLWAWGEEADGWPVLGLNNIKSTSALRRIGTETDWVSLAVADTHSLAIKSDGTLWAWGGNHHYQLGDGTETSQLVPAPSVPGNEWKQAAAGAAHSFALKKDGTLWAWGDNWAGQLGIGTFKKSPIAVQVGSGHDWKRIWAGGVQTVGQQTDGSLWFWGSLTGEASDTNRWSAPRRISADTNWVDVCFGYFTVFGIKSDGTLWSWGREAHTYTGSAQRLIATPTKVGTDTDWRACASAEGGFYHLLQKSDGSLWAMDASEHRFTGKSSYGPIKRPKIGLEKDVVAIAAGHDSIGLVLTRDGEVWTWGESPAEHTSGDKLFQQAAELMNRLRPGQNYNWGNSSRMFWDKPWQVSIVDPGDSSSQ